MPGIYINDGGQTSSAIGNILGGIAQQVGPEGAAKAALLQQQTQGADISNQDAYEKLLAGEAAANSAAGLTRTLNMNAPDPGQPSVAGTVTSLSQPPSATPGPGGRISRIDESGFTPEQKYIANEILNGRMSPAALQTGVDVFQTPLVGAGATPGAVRTRSTTPLSPGQIINISGQPGGPTIGGGSAEAEAGDRAAGAADVGLANSDLETGNAAQPNLAKIDPLVDLYKTVVAPGTTDVNGKIATTVKEKLANYFQVPLERFDDPAAAKALIRSQLLTFVGGLRDSAGTPFSPRQTQLIIDQIPDPNADPQGFLASMNWVRAHLQTQVSNAAAAQHFLDTRASDSKAGPAFHAQRGTNAGAEAEAIRAAGLKVDGGGEAGPAPAPAPAPAPPAPPASPDASAPPPNSPAAPKVAKPADVYNLPLTIKYFTDPNGVVRLIPGRK